MILHVSNITEIPLKEITTHHFDNMTHKQGGGEKGKSFFCNPMPESI